MEFENKNDKIETIQNLKEKMNMFSKERGWDKVANAKDLSMALTVEASELMEIFQWVHSDEVKKLKENEAEFTHIKEEIADVFWYLMRICDYYDIDLTQAVYDKAIKNAKKYPK